MPKEYKQLPLPLSISEDYDIDFIILDGRPHDCKACDTNLDIYSTHLEVDEVRPELYDVRCRRCGSVTTIEDLSRVSRSGRKGRD